MINYKQTIIGNLWLLLPLLFANQAFGQLYTPGGSIFAPSNSTTNVAIGDIGTTVPVHYLHIMGNPETNVNIFRTNMAGVPGAYLEIKAGPSSSSDYAPVFWGHNEIGEYPSLTIRASCGIGEDNPTNPPLMVFDFDEYSTPSTLTLDAGSRSTIQHRPLFDCTNAGNLVMRMMPNSGGTGATLAIDNSSNIDTRFSLDLGGGLVMGTPGGNRLIFDTRNWLGGDFMGLEPTASNTPALYFVSGKGIGIGTYTVPSGVLLAVGGTICATQVNVVSQWWSDFVFDKDYKLASLDSVASYIKVNKHLPDMPSAADLKKTKLDLGDMEAKQMQKIEELTLYTIDQDQKLKQQSLAIATQQAEIDELKAMVTKMRGKQ